MNGISRLLALLAFTVTLLPEAQAITRTWDNGAPTIFWDDGDNWDPDGNPAPGDDAVVQDGDSPEVNTLEIFNELTNGGTINITTGTLQPQGEVSNDGTINVGDGSAIRSQLIIGSAVTLTGTGEVILKNSDDLPLSDAVVRGGAAAANPAVNDAGHTIRGEGSLVQHWINNGVIRAEETSGDATAVLRIDNGTLLNNGELSASPGASIELTSVTLTQGAGGTLTADTLPIVFPLNNTLIGGTLASANGGVFQQTAGFVDLFGVTNTGTFNTEATLRTNSTGLVNNGVINLDSGGGGNASFSFSESGEISGDGELVLARRTQSFVTGLNGIVFTNGADHTVRGAGTIVLETINEGTIRAEAAVDGDVLTVNNEVANSGLLSAASGATLRLVQQADITQNATGRVRALDGGTVLLQGNTITGGRITTGGSGTVEVEVSSTVEDTTNSGTLNVQSSRALRLAGSSFTNDGVVTLNSNNVNAPGTLQYTSDVTLDGDGEVVLQTPGTQPSRVVPFGEDVSLTQGANHTIRGEGFLAGDIVNRGRIEGDSATDPITVFGLLSGAGPLENVVINGSVFNGFGVHSPGESTAVAPLEGDYTITATGTLAIELGGTAPGSEHDQLSSNGTVNLGGTLNVSLLEDYDPVAGDRFTIIESTGDPIAGTFVTEQLPTVLPTFDLTWAPVEYNAQSVVLEIATVVAVTPGDFNGDGTVDLLDLDILGANFGSEGVTRAEGDANGDGTVDLLDLDILGANFGSDAGVAVPEPGGTAALLFVVAAHSIAGRGRRLGRDRRSD